MSTRKIVTILIIIICIISLAYGIYYQLFYIDVEKIEKESEKGNTQISEIIEFDKLFDNKMNNQGYNVNKQVKIDSTKDLVYTNYEKSEAQAGKYDIKVNIPIINIKSENISKINREINTVFQEKANNIIANSGVSTIYTVEYTAYLNENILSIVIKSTLKEGTNAQRLIIKAYTYNLSTDQIIPLSDILNIQGKNIKTVRQNIKETIEQSIEHTRNLSALGYNVYERNINNEIYNVEKSNNYLLGPNGVIYIIYAYGNTSITSEKDVVVIQ